jgi:RimJ/RimL family protein N-acetyltransferase
MRHGPAQEGDHKVLGTHHPTLIPLPDELRSPRLLLRPYRPADADQVFAAVDESRAHLRPWMGWVDAHVSVDNSRDWCARCAANWLLRSELTVGIFAAASGRFLGCVSLHDPDWDLRAFGIGYWLRASAIGQGYATEAVCLLVDLAIGPLAARRVELRCDARNGPSQRVAERAGFVLEGRLRNAFLAPDGQPADELVFALTPDDARLRPV